MDQVRAANSAAKCWTVISGKVYNLTGFISQHPDGQAAIMSICDKDGTQAFQNQHGSQQNPNQILSGLQIGVLK